jgi:phosphopantothenoylcysteine decarboxylase/phosphopantothenate--cysteine ligase
MKRVLLGVSGSIAAYKAVQIASDLTKLGCDVRACLTSGATRFVTPLSFEAITGRPAAVEVWEEQPGASRMGHIELGRWADAIVVAPATANTLARLALGLADDMLSAAALTARAPLLLAPAMETAMWEHPAIQDHVKKLHSRGATFVGPESGRLASGAEGEGRMSEPSSIVEAVLAMLAHESRLSGISVLVTAGPTYEAIDPVRFIGNRSSGKMGYALADVASRRGADVVLIAGPTALMDPPGIRVVHVESSSELCAAALERVVESDVVVMAAAIADYRPASVSDEKIRRKGNMQLELVPIKDIAAELSSAAPHAIHVGFALDRDNATEDARAKLIKKGQQLVVANAFSGEFSPFGADTNRATLVTASEAKPLPLMLKRELAERVWDEIERLLISRGKLALDPAVQ